MDIYADPDEHDETAEPAPDDRDYAELAEEAERRGRLFYSPKT